jgi:putative ABC transport system permease protein
LHTIKAFFHIICSDFKREKTLTILSIIGVALGIALYISVSIATDRGIKTFKSDVYSLSEGYNYEVVPTTDQFISNNFYKKVSQITNDLSPVITINSIMDNVVQDYLKIYGIDIFTVKVDRFFNQFEGALQDFFTIPNAIILNENFAKTHKIKLNDTINLIVSDRKYTFIVKGFYSTKVLPENFVMMDIGNCQELFNIYGLSRIDVYLKNTKRLSNILPPNYLLLEKNDMLQRKESIVQSFTYNLKFISFIAVLVGFFILYNAVFTSVIKSRPNIGILRCIGFKRQHILLLYIIKGAIIGLTGSIIGIILAQFLSFFSISMAEKTISTIYTPISIYDVFLNLKNILQALTIGIATSIIASIISAYEASKVSPISASLPSIAETSFANLYKISFICGIFLTFSGILISLFEYLKHPFNQPLLSYVGIFLIIFGFTFITPIYLKIFLKIIKRPIKKAFSFIGNISLNDISGSITRFSTALVSVMISSALIISFFVLIHSFERNLTEWIDQNLKFDVFIKASSCSSNFCFEPLSTSVNDILKDFKEIEDVNQFRTLQGFYEGKPTLFGFANEYVVKKYTKNIIDPDIGKKKEVAASEYFAIKYNIKIGDIIKIATPEGTVAFRVREIFKTYSSTMGFLIFDRYWLEKLWHKDDTTQLNIYLKKGASSSEFIKKLESRLPSSVAIDIYDNNRLKVRVLEIFDRTFAITYAIQIIAFIISLIGMINTIFTIILEKSHNISILRYIGCSYNKIKSIFMCSASIVGLAGIFLGFILGGLISFIMIKIINIISFGWLIDIFIPYSSIAGLLVLLYITIIASVFIPVSYIKKINVKKSINF